MTRLQAQDAERRRVAGLGRDHSEALARGMAVIVSFDATRREQTLAEVAERVRLPRATARRALLTLAALGYVVQEGRRFRLAPSVLRLAAAYLTSNAVSVLLQPACDRLARATGQPCTAAVLEGRDVVMVARALPAQAVPAGAGIGFRLPAYCSALGRALLSGQPDEAVDKYLAAVALEAVTPYTSTDRGAVRSAIADARDTGFCYVDQEAEHGFRSIAVPLRRFDGVVVAALNVGARVEAADAATMAGPFLSMLRAEAAALDGHLG